MNEEDTAAYIFHRKQSTTQANKIFSYLDNVIIQENQLHEYEFVCFLHDCYSNALNKVLKLKQGINSVGKITKNGKNYPKYVSIIPLITKHKINPVSLFTFIVETRRLKKIPPTVANIVTERAVEHYLKFLKKNAYQSKTYLNCPTYEKTLYNQFNIDLVSLTTFLLRKANVALNPQDVFLLSPTSKALLFLTEKLPYLTLPEVEKAFYEDLKEDKDFLARITKRWNKILDIQIQRVDSMYHKMPDKSLQRKLEQVMALLKVLFICA